MHLNQVNIERKLLTEQDNSGIKLGGSGIFCSGKSTLYFLPTINSQGQLQFVFLQLEVVVFWFFNAEVVH